MKPPAWRHNYTEHFYKKPQTSIFRMVIQSSTFGMSHSEHKYEFGGPLGAAGITFGLPVLLLSFYFGCNDISGCPAPSLLSPYHLTWDRLVAETGWQGLGDLFRWEVMGVVLGYYLLNLTLGSILPARELNGTKLAHHDHPLRYRLNAFSTSLAYLVICAIGTYIHGADFTVWTYIADNYVRILTANLVISYTVSMFLYIRSFSVNTNYPNSELRELASGGNTGNHFYDFFIGRELNPRITLPLFGEIDIKFWCGIRPGLTGWMLLDLAFMAKQYRTYGFVSDSIVIVTLAQAYYVLEGQYNEAGFLTMMDITTDGLGFMLTFGDLVWVPFLYSTQCRYLSVYPVHLGVSGVIAVGTVFALGLYIFRAANTQKIIFRTRPHDPRVAGLSYIQTKRGTKLLTDGWWGMSRHINYFGDWIQALPFCLPAGLAGYTFLPAGSAAVSEVFKMLDGREVVQGEARGWGTPFTYFYALYFAILLVHRETRDDALCAKKYGEDWKEYKRIVRWRILPGVY